jgi:hypothetical protein
MPPCSHFLTPSFAGKELWCGFIEGGPAARPWSTRNDDWSDWFSLIEIGSELSGTRARQSHDWIATPASSVCDELILGGAMAGGRTSTQFRPRFLAP